TWESVMFASQHKLANLVAMVDYNKIQAMGPTEGIINLDPLIDKWKAFGWNAVEVGGHDFEPIFGALESLSSEKPNVIIMRTVKGKGISFMENTTLWHYRPPDDEEYKLALKELSK
ncbi:MAG: transketolase, partial [Candidatus Desulfatibia sp.]